VSGTNQSPVHLVGYFSPMEEHVTGSPFDMGDDLEEIGDDELTEEELAEMDDQTKHKLLQNMMGRKRKLAEMEKDIESRMTTENETEPITSAKKNKRHWMENQNQPSKAHLQIKMKTKITNKKKSKSK